MGYDKNVQLGMVVIFSVCCIMQLIGDDSVAKSVAKFAKNPSLVAMKSLEFKTLPRYYADNDVLDFSGMVYDQYRHKILTFGGGHATAKFPNSVHEFSFDSLEWTALTADVPPAEYTAENSVKSKDGQKLGGVKWQGKIWAGSRHTYDGLVMLPDGRMAVPQIMEHRGGYIEDYRKNYQGGSGLWIFDPVKKEWSVSKTNNLSVNYSVSEMDPEQGDFIFLGRSSQMAGKKFRKLNWKTESFINLKSAPRSSMDSCLTYFPGNKSFLFFTKKNGNRSANIYEYSIEGNSWKVLNPGGVSPDTYSLGVVYDSKQNVFGLFSSKQFHYYSPAQNKWYTLDKKYPIKRLYHHIVYDTVNNIYVMCGEKWDTYLFKFSDVVGEFDGTGLEVTVKSAGK